MRYAKKHQIRHSLRVFYGATGLVVLVFVLTFGIGLSLLYYNKSEFAQYWHGRRNQFGDFKLVVVGDSISQSLGASKPEYGLAGLLAAQIEQTTGRTVQVINLSKSGATTKEALSMQAPQLTKFAPYADLVVLEIGANDMRQYNADTFAKNYEQLLQTLPPGKSLATDLPVFLGHNNLTRQAEAANFTVHALAKRYQVPVAPVYAALQQKITTTPWPWICASDLFHPNDRGYRVWYDATWPVAAKVIRH